ncbi:hypothetical protein ACQ4PT_043798 [Festuca glaucescens]
MVGGAGRGGGSKKKGIQEQVSAFFKGKKKKDGEPSGASSRPPLGREGRAARLERCLVHVGFVRPSRLPSGILGCLIREHYPGLVTLPDGTCEPAWTYYHYKHAKDNSKFVNVATRVLNEFWDFFTPAEGKEDECCRVVGKLLRKLIPEMYYEARVRCVINWYVQEKRISLPKSNARLRLMTREQYNLVPPQWCASNKVCYARIVDNWAKWDEDRRHAEEAERELAKVKATLQSHDARFASYDQLFAGIPSTGSHNPSHQADTSPATPAGSTSMPPLANPDLHSLRRQFCEFSCSSPSLACINYA